MKQSFSKLLAVLLTVSLCVPSFPAERMQAAETDSISWSAEETIPVKSAVSEERSSNFNEGWKFYLGDSSTAQNVNFEDSSWTDISLPHDFSIFQNFTSNGEAESGFLPGGTGWYRKKFSLPDSFQNKSIVLNFDGVYSDAYVYVNGTKLGEHHYGYTSFSFDISEYLICDDITENVIAVKAVNNIPTSRWYSGSGIYRDVTLIVTDPVHVDVDGTAITTPNLKTTYPNSGNVTIKADIVNDTAAGASVTVRNTVYQADETAASSPVSTNITVPAGQTVSAESSLTVNNPDLWSIDTPENTYFVRTEVLIDNTVVDTYDTDFGFRWYEFDDTNGFSLNGKNIKLNGVCMHHDQGALGSAAYYDAMYRQLSIMKEMGTNAIRITHNPGDKQFLEICNQLGLLVIEEFFDGWDRSKNSNSNDFGRYFYTNITQDNQILGGSSSMPWAKFTLRSTVKRDRNEPSLIMWSLGNEVQQDAASGTAFSTTVNTLISWTQEIDTSHTITNGSNERTTSGEMYQVSQAVDRVGIPGYNYASANDLSTLHNIFGCIIASETASAINSRSMYKTDLHGHSNASTYASQYGYHLTSYDTSAVSWGKTAQASMWDTIRFDYVAGQFVWTGFDYIGEPTPWNGTTSGDYGRGCVPNSSYFGIVETTGFPKDSYYLYRSQWNQDKTSPTLHLVTAWDSANMMSANGKTPVVIYSNAPKVELYRTVGNTTTKLATATRTVNTTNAGHKYYTYSTATENSSLCTAVNGTDAASQYSKFMVSFSNGTIFAKAYDGNTEITEQCIGTKSITTPGSVSKLSASSDKSEIYADGSSLSYITVDVTDADGNLKTTADNTIRFSLTGNGEILGVDNGDQATRDKYQQSSVLFGSTSASIKAYGGKALVIVRSTKESGSFTVTAESSGLTSSSVTVKTKTVTDASSNQLESYTLKRHCYVPVGTPDITEALPKTISAVYTDGTKKTFDASWNSYDTGKLSQKGDFTITGSFTDQDTEHHLSINVHVYNEIAGVQGFSLCTAPNVMPTLPTSSMTYDIDGDTFIEFPVSWHTNDITQASFSEIGSIVPITGVVTALGREYPTKATIRVATPNVTYTNVAIEGERDHLTDNGVENGSTTTGTGDKTYNDTLTAITDGVLIDNGSSTSRWSDWNNKNVDKAQDNIQIAMDWATAITTDKINLYFFKSDNDNDKASSVLPSKVTIEYAYGCQYNEKTKMLEAEWIPVSYSEPTDIEGYTTGVTIGKSYQLEKLINPQAIRFTFGHEANKFIGLNEIEVLKPDYTYTQNTSASLDGLTIGEETISFEPQKTDYHVSASPINISEITFQNPENAAITLIQKSHTEVKIITVSEDGKDSKTYTLTVNPKLALQEKLNDYKNEVNESELKEDFGNLESYTKLQDLINEINNSMTGSPDQAQIQDNLEKLETAYHEFYADALDKKLEDYKDLDETDYTPESYKPFQNQITAIKNMNTATMTGNELKNCLNSLKAAYAALINAEKPPVNPNPPVVTPPGPDTPVITPPGPNPDNKDDDPDPNPSDVLTLNDKITIDSVEYQVIDTKANTVAAVKLTNKKASKITIPDTVSIKKISCRVVKINDKVFQSATKLKTVKLGKYVAAIGKNAFAKCKKLKTITFQETNVTIGKGAFKKAKSGITVKGTKKLKGKKKSAFKKKLTKAGMKNPKLK